MAGVTFGEGQPLSSSLGRGDGLYLQREPRNPADPDAVAVHTPAGHRVGYVPRVATGDACVGRAARAVVRSVGRAGGDGPWGVAVAAWPALLPLTLDVLPPPLTGAAASLSALLAPEEWGRLRDAAAADAHYRCAVSGGVGPRWPVEVHEVWDVDEEARVARLVGLEALAPSVHAARHGLALTTLAGVAAARATLAAVNGWSEAEVDAHWGAAAARAEGWRGGGEAGEGWRVDADWLEGRGVGVPREWGA